MFLSPFGVENRLKVTPGSPKARFPPWRSEVSKCAQDPLLRYMYIYIYSKNRYRISGRRATLGKVASREVENSGKRAVSDTRLAVAAEQLKIQLSSFDDYVYDYVHSATWHSRSFKPSGENGLLFITERSSSSETLKEPLSLYV